MPATGSKMAPHKVEFLDNGGKKHKVFLRGECEETLTERIREMGFYPLRIALARNRAVHETSEDELVSLQTPENRVKKEMDELHRCVEILAGLGDQEAYSRACQIIDEILAIEDCKHLVEPYVCIKQVGSAEDYVRFQKEAQERIETSIDKALGGDSKAIQSLDGWDFGEVEDGGEVKSLCCLPTGSLCLRTESSLKEVMLLNEIKEARIKGFFSKRVVLKSSKGDIHEFKVRSKGFDLMGMKCQLKLLEEQRD
jgi:hypothetical protein